MYPPASTISVHSASHPIADQRLPAKTKLPVGLIIILPAATPAIPDVVTSPTDAPDTIRSSRLTRPSILTSVPSSGTYPSSQLFSLLYWLSPLPFVHVNCPNITQFSITANKKSTCFLIILKFKCLYSL